MLEGIRGYLGCILCQIRLRLSWKVDECKPLSTGGRACFSSGSPFPDAVVDGRGLHSSTIRLNVSKICGMRWVHDFTPVY